MTPNRPNYLNETYAMPKLLYCALFITLATLSACAGPEMSSSPTAVAQAPAAASIPAPTTAPAETPAAPTEAPAPTDAPSETTPESGMLVPNGMNDPEAFMSQLPKAELSCLSEIGDPQQLLKLTNSTELTPQERDALAGCLEHETLLKIFLKRFTDQTGPLSSDTSACISAGSQNLDLCAMMLTSPEGPDEEAGIVQVMAGLIIMLACLDEPEWQAASQSLDLPPDGREALQCAMDLLGGPEGIVASMESKEGEQPMAFFNAATKCGLTMPVD